MLMYSRWLRLVWRFKSHTEITVSSAAQLTCGLVTSYRDADVWMSWSPNRLLDALIGVDDLYDLPSYPWDKLISLRQHTPALEHYTIEPVFDGGTLFLYVRGWRRTMRLDVRTMLGPARGFNWLWRGKREDAIQAIVKLETQHKGKA